MAKDYKILVINPGSTSTKVALFSNEQLLFDKKIEHSSEELSVFHKIIDQYEFRLDIILNFLKEKGIDYSVLDVVVGRGGLLKPIASGTYRVNDKMLEDLRKGVSGEHASNLGGLLAHGIAEKLSEKLSIPSYIVDPVVIDEMKPVARVSGIPEIPRISILHALNQKAIARKAALDLGKDYEKVNFIIAHLGGGISVGVIVREMLLMSIMLLMEKDLSPRKEAAEFL